MFSETTIFLPLVKSNAFIGMEQYQIRLRETLDEAVRVMEEENSVAKNNFKRKCDESDESHPIAKKQKNSIDDSGLNKMCKNRNMAVESEKIKCSVPQERLLSERLNEKTKLKVVKTNASVTSNKRSINKNMAAKSEKIKCSAPQERLLSERHSKKPELKVDKSTVMIKMNTFVQGKKQYMCNEAVLSSEQKSNLKRKATTERETDRESKLQKTSNETFKVESCGSQLRIKYSLKLNFTGKNMIANSKQTKNCEQKDKLHLKSKANLKPTIKSKAEDVSFQPLERCNAFIGQEQYKRSMQSILNETTRVGVKHSATKTKREIKSEEHPESIVGRKQKSSNGSKTLNGGKVTNDVTAKYKKIQHCEQRPSKTEPEEETFSPLERCSAFIGQEQYAKSIQEHTQRILAKKQKTSNGSKSLNSGTDVTAKNEENKHCEQRQSKTEPEKETFLPLGLCSAFIGQKQYAKSIQQISNEVSSMEEPPERLLGQTQNSILNETFSPLAICSAFIGQEQYAKSIQPIANEASSMEEPPERPLGQIQNSTLNETKNFNDTKASNDIKTSNDGKVTNNICLTNKMSSSKPTQSQIVLAKSEQRKRKMTREQLQRMDEPLQQWNNYFGTNYSIF